MGDLRVNSRPTISGSKRLAAVAWFPGSSARGCSVNSRGSIGYGRKRFVGGQRVEILGGGDLQRLFGRTLRRGSLGARGVIYYRSSLGNRLNSLPTGVCGQMRSGALGITNRFRATVVGPGFVYARGPKPVLVRDRKFLPPADDEWVLSRPNPWEQSRTFTRAIASTFILAMPGNPSHRAR